MITKEVSRLADSAANKIMHIIQVQVYYFMYDKTEEDIRQLTYELIGVLQKHQKLQLIKEKTLKTFLSSICNEIQQELKIKYKIDEVDLNNILYLILTNQCAFFLKIKQILDGVLILDQSNLVDNDLLNKITSTKFKDGTINIQGERITTQSLSQSSVSTCKISTISHKPENKDITQLQSSKTPQYNKLIEKIILRFQYQDENITDQDLFQEVIQEFNKLKSNNQLCKDLVKKIISLKCDINDLLGLLTSVIDYHIENYLKDLDSNKLINNIINGLSEYDQFHKSELINRLSRDDKSLCNKLLQCIVLLKDKKEAYKFNIQNNLYKEPYKNLIQEKFFSNDELCEFLKDYGILGNDSYQENY